MDPAFLALAILILLFSVILHEVMHGWVALKFGDRTAQNMGRLTLNPLPHIDPLGTILFPLLLIISGSSFIIGWAKPVPINPLNFKNIKQGELWVSLAGVLANFTLAIFASLLFHLSRSFAPDPIPNILSFTVTINLILGVFNLLPLPPLDGSRILLSQLPISLAIKFQSLERYGLLILLLLWFIPFGNSSILQVMMAFFIGLINLILQVPLRLF